MADTNYEIFSSEDGFYTTLKALKNLKFGDTVQLTDIKTPIVQYPIPKEIDNDPESWDAFSKIFVASQS